MTPPARRLRLEVEGLVKGVGSVRSCRDWPSLPGVGGLGGEQPHPVSAWSWRGRKRHRIFLERLDLGAAPQSSIAGEQWVDQLGSRQISGFRFRPPSEQASSPSVWLPARFWPAPPACGAGRSLQPPCGYASPDLRHCGPRFSILRACRFERAHSCWPPFSSCAWPARVNTPIPANRAFRPDHGLRLAPR